MIHAIKSVINLRSVLRGPLYSSFPYDCRERTIYIPVSRALIPHLQYSHKLIMGMRTGTFCKEDEDSEEVAALFDAFSDVSY